MRCAQFFCCFVVSCFHLIFCLQNESAMHILSIKNFRVKNLGGGRTYYNVHAGESYIWECARSVWFFRNSKPFLEFFYFFALWNNKKGKKYIKIHNILWKRSRILHKFKSWKFCSFFWKSTVKCIFRKNVLGNWLCTIQNFDFINLEIF